MDACARHICFLLQFFSVSAEEQVAYCGSLLPEDAFDMAPRPDDSDERRYNSYWAEKEGDPLLLLYEQFYDYLPIFSNLEENTLPEDETILQEISCLLNLMAFFQGNSPGFNRFWGVNSVREGEEWRLLRRISRTALAELGWPATLPSLTFEELLLG